jgi:hypothetical protein
MSNGQPGPASHGQCPGLGTQVGGNGALDFRSALGQMGCHVGRQLQAQFEHGAGHVVEQLTVLLGGFHQVAPRMREPDSQQG